MTVSIDIPENSAARFQAQAQARGLTVDRYLLVEPLEIAEQNAPVPSTAHLQITDPKEWARQFHNWAESHDRTTPLLSEEAVSRESIDPDRT